MRKNICIYIDGANFYGGLTSINKKYSDNKFDFEKYIKSIIDEDNLIKVYYYNALVKKKINKKIWLKQYNFFERLRKINKFKVCLCTRKSRLNILGEEYHTIKGDDIYLALDMIEDCYNNIFDKAILISGDGDFLELIKRIKKKSKEVELIYFEKCISKDLLKNSNCSKIINKKIVKRFFYNEDK